MKGHIVAEKELQKFKADSIEDKLSLYLFFMKSICDIELFPPQIMAADQYFRYKYCIEVKPPRTGKSLGKAGINIYELATNPQEDLKIYPPTFRIGKDALSYHYNWISASPVLSAFIRRRAGKKQLSTISYEFANLSNAEIISVSGKIEGHNVTIMDIMEFDLWNWDIFQNDVMRRGAAKNVNGLPTRVRIDGTILGKENIHKLLNTEAYKKLFRNLMIANEGNILGIPAGTKIDVHMYQAMNILDNEFVKLQKIMMSFDEWARSMLLRFTESTNFIWSSYILAVQKKALSWNLEGVPFEKGGKYKSSGTVSFGFDCGHAGQKKESSKYSLQFYEQIGMYRRWINSFEWPADADIRVMTDEMLEIFAYYRPAGGNGDALGHRLIADIDDKAFKLGIHRIDRTEFPENTPGNWAKWWFSPIWNNPREKHSFYTSLRQGIYGGTCYYPFYEASDTRRIAIMCRKLIKVLLNIKQETTKGTYPSYFAKDSKIGDDEGDAAGMANLWLDTHLQLPVNMNLLGSTGKSRRTSDLISGSVSGKLNISRENINDF